MKRKSISILIALLIILIGLTSAGSIGAWTSSDIRPADGYSDPADYELIIIDSDRWELRMNHTSEAYYVRRYKGILLYNWGSQVYVGNLSASYDKTKNVLLVTCIDTGWNDRTLSYALQDSQGETYIGQRWDLTGNYLFLESGYSYKIGADIVKGSLN